MSAASPSPERELKRGVLEMVLLRVLLEGRTYGYRLVSEIASRSQGELEVKEGTLYPLLYRLEEQGLVRTEWDTPGPGAPRRGSPRKYYRLTPAGRGAFEDRAEQWRRFSRRVDELIARPDGFETPDAAGPGPAGPSPAGPSPGDKGEDS